MLRNDQFVRHNSIDNVYVPPEPMRGVHYGGSYLSLPDLNQANVIVEQQPFDWLTPRAERQISEMFPVMDTVAADTKSSPSSSQYSPHSSSPRQYAFKDRRMSVTPRQQQQTAPPAFPTRPFVCDQCQTGFPSAQELRHHSIEHHIDDQDRITFTCPVCNDEFLGRTTLINAHLPKHYRYDTTFGDIRLRLG